MRLSALACSGLLAALASGAGMASPVGELTSFTSGSPARASEVNANFDALKSAVNDTDARLGAVESDLAAVESGLAAVESSVGSLENNKQNRITGSCMPGMAVTSIGADGSVTCEQWRESEGSYQVSPWAFVGEGGQTDGCEYRPSHTFQSMGFFTGTQINHCRAIAQLQLPQGAELAGVTCRVTDAKPGNMRIYAELVANNARTFDLTQSSGTSYLATTNNSSGVDNATAVEVVGATTSTSMSARFVDNNTRLYFLRLFYYSDGSTAFDSILGNLGVFGCRVTYHY